MQLEERVKVLVGKDYEGINKVVLAFSGGLDTSVIAAMFKDMGIEVVTMTLEIGQQEDMGAVDRKAKKLGTKHYGMDVREEFVNEYISRAIKTNCMYQGTYPNATALSRPLIAKYLVEVAKNEGAQAVAHGSTGKGNDQIRIDNGVAALSDLKVIAPVRDWELWRDEEIDYAKRTGLDVNVSKKKPYSFDQNMWGRSMECGPIEYPDHEIPADAYEWTVAPEKAPDKPTIVDITFESGLPVSVEANGETTNGLIKVIEMLNKLAGENGVGRIDHLEDRVIGFKSREGYESPAALVIIPAHKDLEKYVLSKDEISVKWYLDKIYADLVYEGKWYSPVRKEIDMFMEESQRFVSGTVKMKLFKGSATVVSRKSTNALYSMDMASYDKGTTWSQKEGGAFTKIYGLQNVAAYKKRYLKK